MAYQFKDLSVLAYANGFTLWHYTTQDESNDLAAAGAFDPAADMLRTGDIIIANAGGNDAPTALMLLVTAVDSGRKSERGSVTLRNLLPEAA